MIKEKVEIEESIKMLAASSTEERVCLKVIEELFELGEVLTKPEGSKPSKEKIIEEMGDVVARMAVLAFKLGIEAEVGERAEFKIEQVLEWLQSNKK